MISPVPRSTTLKSQDLQPFWIGVASIADVFGTGTLPPPHRFQARSPASDVEHFRRDWSHVGADLLAALRELDDPRINRKALQEILSQ